jgi:hypothetical protein
MDQQKPHGKKRWLELYAKHGEAWREWLAEAYAD